MQSTKITINHYFDVLLNKKYKYPLNLNFKCKIDKKNKLNLSSNGIYFIIEKETNNIIYIGINLSKDLNKKYFVDKERILKHLQSLTMRGTKIGIKGKKKDWFIKCDKINQELFSLRDNIPNKDTGTTSDKNRLSYANIYWEKFKKNENFLSTFDKHFYAYYFKIDFFEIIMKKFFSENITKKKSKKLFKKDIEVYFEDPLSKEYRPYIYIVKKSKNYPYKGNWNSITFNVNEVKSSILKLIDNYKKKN